MTKKTKESHRVLLPGLQQRYVLERDPDKKRKILEQMLDSILPGWEQLFLSLPKEENPQKVLRLLAELTRVDDRRRAGGLAGETISAVGLSKIDPVATNSTASGRQQNRRVELVVSGEPISV